MDYQQNNGLLSSTIPDKKILDLLSANKDKNFVKRMLTPDDYPVLEDWNGPDTFGTHAISYVTGDDGAYVYPTIIQGDDGNLMLKKGIDAWNHAKSTGEYIRVPTQADAEHFGRNYKTAAGWTDQTFNVMKQKAHNQRLKKSSNPLADILTGHGQNSILSDLLQGK